MSIEDLAERQRQDAIAAQTRRAQNRQEQAQFFGSGGVNASDGENIPATTLSNGPTRAGQSVPVFRSGGSVEYDTVSRLEPEEPLIPLIQTGDVAVLATVRVADGTWQLWLGGDRKTPLRVADNLSERPFATLELIGVSRDDWIVSLQYDETIRLIYGNDSAKNWESTSPINRFVFYHGGGFWCDRDIRDYRPDEYRFAAINDTDFPTRPIETTFNELGSLIQENCHPLGPGSDGAYCEAVYISGETVVRKAGGNDRSGFVAFDQNLLEFTGVNVLLERHNASSEWVGDTIGADYIGDGGAPCSLGQPQEFTSASFPKIVNIDINDSLREFNSQCYFLSVYQAQLQIDEGVHSIHEDSNDTLTYNEPQRLKKIDFSSSCVEYASPTQYLLNINASNVEIWPQTLPSATGDRSPITVNLSNEIRLLPNLTKNYSYAALKEAQESIVGQATVERYYSGFCFDNERGFKGGTYRKVMKSGNDALIRATDGLFREPTLNVSDRDFLFFNNEEIEVSLNDAGFSPTWTLEDRGAGSGDGVFPSEFGRSVGGGRFPRRTSLGENLLSPDTAPQNLPKTYPIIYEAYYPEDDIFSKSSKSEVYKYKGTIVNNRLEYSEVSKTKKKVLSMAAIADETNLGTAEILDQKYYPK
jgi:hypothetical protein